MRIKSLPNGFTELSISTDDTTRKYKVHHSLKGSRIWIRLDPNNKVLSYTVNGRYDVEIPDSELEEIINMCFSA